VPGGRRIQPFWFRGWKISPSGAEPPAMPRQRTNRPRGSIASTCRIRWQPHRAD
jgi:hypothetical protein